MVSKAYAAGFAFAILTALIIFLIVWKFTKNKNLKGRFDERQELVRGRGYKYACFTFLGLITLDLLAEGFNAFETTPVSRSLALFFIILTGVMVYAVYCVMNDSYFGVGQDTRTYRALMWIIVACNAFSAFAGFRKGMLVDGKLDFGATSALLICVAFAILGLALSARKRKMAMEEASEDASEDDI